MLYRPLAVYPVAEVPQIIPARRPEIHFRHHHRPPLFRADNETAVAAVDTAADPVGPADVRQRAR